MCCIIIVTIFQAVWRRRLANKFANNRKRAYRDVPEVVEAMKERGSKFKKIRLGPQYGISNYRPIEDPHGEDAASVEVHINSMKKMFLKPNALIDQAKIIRLKMDKCFKFRRDWIISEGRSTTDVIQEYPFLQCPREVSIT